MDEIVEIGNLTNGKESKKGEMEEKEIEGTNRK